MLIVVARSSSTPPYDTQLGGRGASLLLLCLLLQTCLARPLLFPSPGTYRPLLSLRLPTPPAVSATRKWNTSDGRPTQLIGHRGERAFALPEHTLPSYHMAVWEHADYIEPDLVLTKDGVLVIYHDLTIKSSTDVADRPEFRHLMRNETIWDPDGSGGNVTIVNDWFIQDLTLQELKTLRLRVVGGGRADRNMRRPSFFDGLFSIPTFQEYLDLVRDDSQKVGRPIGVIPEIKHPAWHNARVGRPHYMEDALLGVLRANGYPVDKASINQQRSGSDVGFNVGYPLMVQSFEAEAAKYIRSKSDVDVLQLVFGNVDILTPQGLDEAATYATAIGAWKGFYLAGLQAAAIEDKSLHASVMDAALTRAKVKGGLIPPQELSKEIKKRRLRQMPYTFYSSYEFPSAQRGDAATALHERTLELFYFMALGVDAMFVENVAEANLIRQTFEDSVTLWDRWPDGDSKFQGRVLRQQGIEESIRQERSEGLD